MKISNFYRIFSFIIANLLANQDGWSQTFYGSTFNSLYQFTITNGTCSAQNIGTFQNVQGGTVAAGDICQCPDGSIYITDNTNFYQVDPVTALTTQISNNNSGYLGITGIGCGGDGLIYGGSLNFTGAFLYTFDPATGILNNLGSTGYNCAGDVVFYNDTPYMSSSEGLVELNLANPAASTLVLPIQSGNYIGMTVFPDDCNTLLGGDPQGQLFLLNIETGVETVLCTLPYLVGGLTTIAEFNTIEPCTLAIDLDGDNSSGGTDADYLTPIVNCNTPEVPVADIDMTIISPDVINSITVSIISGLQNTGNETLILTNAPAGLSVTGSGTPTLTIQNNSGTAVIPDFISAVQNILYQNNASSLLAGLRKISVVFETIGGDSSNIANAYVQVVELPGLTVNLGNDTTYCAGNTVSLDAGNPGSTYLWSTGETSASILISTAENYSVTVSNVFACSGADTVNINFNEAITTLLSVTICQGDSVLLENAWQTNPGIYIDQYDTDNECDSSVITTLTVLDRDTFQITSYTCDSLSDGVFTTLLTGQNGCDSIIISTILLLPEESCEPIIFLDDFPLEVFAPNIFSPDHNGINDYFMLFSNDPSAIIRTLQIYDRWGELIYEVKDCSFNSTACGWDGSFRSKPMDTNIFIYRAEIERMNGDRINLKGDFALIR